MKINYLSANNKSCNLNLNNYLTRITVLQLLRLATIKKFDRQSRHMKTNVLIFKF